MATVIATLSVFLQTGLVFSLVAMGYYITYTVLDFPDMTVEGTFLTGAAVFGVLTTHGVNAWLSILAAAIAGALFGGVTGLLHVKLKIRPLLAGILTSTALVTVNLILTSAGVSGDFRGEGSSIISFGASSALHTAFPFGLLPARVGGFPLRDVLIEFTVVIVVKVLLDLFFKTKAGLLLRAAGDSPKYVKTLAKDPGNSKISGLCIGNALAAISGCLYANMAGNVNQSMGIGTIVIGLASLIIGLSVFSKVRFLKPTTKAIFGALIYQACLTAAQLLGVPGAYNRLIMAVLFTVALVLSRMTKKGEPRHA